jgi:hypothetical protein
MLLRAGQSLRYMAEGARLRASWERRAAEAAAAREEKGITSDSEVLRENPRF